MSHYTTVKTRLVDQAALVKALADVGYASVETHATAQPLYGYHGDERADRAHVIIRRRHISSLSNDVGFLRQADGSFTAIISDFDAMSRGFDQAWLDRLQQRYAYHVTVDQLVAQGFSLIEERDENGEIVLTLAR